MASKRPRAPSSCWLAAIFSEGVPAESNCERALAISPKTVCSCFAIPFTVSTRLGIRSARRCSTMSTCDQAAFTASFLLTSVFLTFTYWPKVNRTISNRIATTTSTAINPLLIKFSWKSAPHLCRTSAARALHSINCGRHLLYRCQVARKYICHIKLPAVRFVFSHVQNLQHTGSVEPSLPGQCLYRLALSDRRILAHDH